MRSYHSVPTGGDGFTAGAMFGIVITACIAGIVAVSLLHTRVVIDRAEFMCVERAGSECVVWVKRGD